MTATGHDHTAGAPGYFFTCISGPDPGKRVALTPGDMIVGRSPQCNILSDDPDVGERFALFSLLGGNVVVTGLTTPLPFVDGHPVKEARLAPGQQVRLGRSVWLLGAAATP